MKKPIILFIQIIMLVTLASCSVPAKDNSFKGMDSKTFFEKVTLPEKLSIDINLDEIRQIDEAKSYQTEQVEFDKQKLIDAFIKNAIVDEKIWAEGPQIIASAGNIEEFLTIYDGGDSFGVKTGMRGGFHYSKNKDDIGWNAWNTVASVSFYDPDYGVQQYGYGLNSDYASQKDLDFLSYDDSLIDIKRTFDIVGMPQYDIDETYSLDLETIESHYALYLNRKAKEDESENLSWTKDDECYIFSLRQLVDNIPIVNKVWQMPDGTKTSAWGNPMPPTSIYSLYNKTGITEISANNIMNTTNEIGNSNLINVYEALNIIIEAYSQTILEDETSILSAELCYLSIPDGYIFELVPGWVFRSARNEERDGRTYTQYKYDVVNAVTGKLYQDRW